MIRTRCPTDRRPYTNRVNMYRASAQDPSQLALRRHLPRERRPLSLKNIIAPPATVAIFAVPPLTVVLVGLLTRVPRQLHRRRTAIGTKVGANTEKGTFFPSSFPAPSIIYFVPT